MNNISLLSIDEATMHIVDQLDTLTTLLRQRHRTPTLIAILQGRRTRTKLTETEHAELRTFRSNLRKIEGMYPGIAEAQIEGYTSALEIDPQFLAA